MDTFQYCSGLTILTIPSGVTTIGMGAFRDCSGLTSVHFASPSSVTTIGQIAFLFCTRLTSITIPASVTSIGPNAFTRCSSLTTAYFLSDAPTPFGDWFLDAAPGFTVHYLSSKSGFSSPTWNGYAAAPIDETLHAAAGWLLGHGYPHDSDLSEDLNRDGVNLLMAYALNLDPRFHLQGSLPIPMVSQDTLGMTFYGARPGISYCVETSVDLGTWEKDGVILSDPDQNGLRTASVDRGSPRRFLRLVVSEP